MGKNGQDNGQGINYGIRKDVGTYEVLSGHRRETDELLLHASNFSSAIAGMEMKNGSLYLTVLGTPAQIDDFVDYVNTGAKRVIKVNENH